MEQSVCHLSVVTRHGCPRWHRALSGSIIPSTQSQSNLRHCTQNSKTETAQTLLITSSAQLPLLASPRSSNHGDPPLPLHIAHPSSRLQEDQAGDPRRVGAVFFQAHRLLLTQEAAAAGRRGLAQRRCRELGVVLAARPRRRGAVTGHQPRADTGPRRGVGVRRAERRAAQGHVRGGRRRRAEPRDQVRREASRPRPRVPQEHPDQLHHRPQAHEQGGRVRVRGPGAGEVVPDGGGGEQQGDRGAGHQPEGGSHHRRPGLRAGRRRRDPRLHRLRESPSAGDGREVQRGDLHDGEEAGGGDRRAAGPGRAVVQGEQEGVELQDEGGDGGEARAVHTRRRRPPRHRLRRAHGAVLRLHLQEVSSSCQLSCCLLFFHLEKKEKKE